VDLPRRVRGSDRRCTVWPDIEIFNPKSPLLGFIGHAETHAETLQFGLMAGPRAKEFASSQLRIAEATQTLRLPRAERTVSERYLIELAAC
jgi:hypothetical protein